MGFILIHFWDFIFLLKYKLGTSCPGSKRPKKNFCLIGASKEKTIYDAIKHYQD